MNLETIAESKCFGGFQRVYRHASAATGTAMEFAAFVPESVRRQPAPVLFYLSGLTCTWENFTVKSGFQRHAAEHGVIVIVPDTSPRGEGVPDVSDYDFGKGAGFYVDASVEPWARHYRMYEYVTRELPGILAGSLSSDMASDMTCDMDRLGIFGHSMGGHGALSIALKNPERFKSVSAFAPIVSPMRCPWGQKALSGYLGDERSTWKAYDSCHLVEERGWKGDILIDQGTADQFLERELLPDLFVESCDKAGVPLTLRMQDGYDHSYYFMATFMADHFAWHMERLAA